MLRLTKFARTLSFKLSLTLLTALASLLMVALVIMFVFSRKAVKEEALLKASATREATVQRIDNILLSVEQSAGNIYWKMYNHINQPDKIEDYSRQLVEGNSYINGCAIAFEPGFFKDRPSFLAYYHRSNKDAAGDTSVIKSETIGNRPYYEQAWYINTLSKGTADWMEPLKEEKARGEANVTFCLPIFAREKIVGVMAVDVSLTLLSKIVLETKPSPNSFCVLLGEDGSYIVHPDSTKLNFKTVFTLSNQELDPTAKEAAKAMIAGKTSYKCVRLNDEDYYVFYKPFERSAVPGRTMEKLNWSVGIVYPEEDIFGDYNRLLYSVVIIAIVGLLLLLFLCQTFIQHQIKPIKLLEKSAQRIAEGHYDEQIPDTNHQDEVGHLQRHFQKMQQALNVHVGEMEQLTQTLEKRGKELQTAYEQAQSGDRMKTNFLNNMSNQMITPISEIASNVKIIKDHFSSLTEETTNDLVDNIISQGERITKLLHQLIIDSEK